MMNGVEPDPSRLFIPFFDLNVLSMAGMSRDDVVKEAVATANIMYDTIGIFTFQPQAAKLLKIRWMGKVKNSKVDGFKNLGA